MNGEFIRSEANQLARLILAKVPSGENDRITLAWQKVYQRPPTESEMQVVKVFLKDARATYLATKAKDDTLKTWTDLCQQLLASNEFIYLE
jgi:hypothetical protein